MESNIQENTNQFPDPTRHTLHSAIISNRR